MTDIWQACQGTAHIQRLMATALRIVENQEESATSSIVDSFEEQTLLEALLETSKPSTLAVGYHYLLSTPFRYPPLKYGSRFGDRYSPSLFYGAMNRQTAFAELAYYRLVFLEGPEAPWPENRDVVTRHTLFSVPVNTTKGLILNKLPFLAFAQSISNPVDYQASQALGESMRNAQVEAFTYFSARDPEKGTNIALFTPRAFGAKSPRNQELLLCHSTPEQVSISIGRTDIAVFSKETFLVDGRLPSPAL